MKVALVMAHGKVHNHVGGAPKVFFDMTNYFSHIGYDVLSIYNDERDGSPYYKVPKSVCLENLALPNKYPKLKIYKILREIIRGIDKISCNKINYNPVTQEKQKQVGLAIDPIFQRFQPDIVIAYHVSDLVSLNRYMQWNAKKTIVMCHTDTVRIYQGLANYERLILDTVDVVHVLLNSYKKFLESKISAPIKVIGNVVKSKSENCNSSSKKIIYLARIEKNKQQHIIIEAFRQIPSEIRSGWTVDFYGSCNDKSYQESLNVMIDSYGLRDVVELKGVTEKPFEELRGASICAFPSAFEGFPLALTEAMSMGLACVGLSSCSGVNELIINGENGFLVTDVDGFSQALEKLICSQELRELMGRKAKKAMEKYSEESIWSEWIKLMSK